RGFARGGRSAGCGNGMGSSRSGWLASSRPGLADQPGPGRRQPEAELARARGEGILPRGCEAGAERLHVVPVVVTDVVDGVAHLRRGLEDVAVVPVAEDLALSA